MGHVRDLPKKKLGVDVNKGFAAEYEVLPSRKKVLDELKSAAKDAKAIYLAADPDREGEAICWHLSEALGARGAPQGQAGYVQRDHKTSHRRSLQKRRQPRRERRSTPNRHVESLDRLVGYKVSPILWDKVRRGISAGRVQSVALRMICDREREVRAFKPVEYWTAAAHLEASSPPLVLANLARHAGKKIEIGDGEQAAKVRKDLEAASFRVAKVQAKQRRRNPVPPFITSKLQQEAFKKLRFSVKKTMQVAQRLYEGKGDRETPGPSG